MTAGAQQSGLACTLRRRDLTGLLLNAMVGAGMLTAPTKVFELTGGWSFIVLLVSALALLPLIGVFADLGSRFSATGGPYLYVREGLSPTWGFVAGWLLWVSQAMSTATLVNLLVSYLAGFAPGLATGPARLAAIAALGIAMMWIVRAGIAPSARVSNVLIVVKIAFVALCLLAGLPFVDLGHVTLGPPPELGSFASAMLVYMYAYTGFERGAVLAGEARDPRRDVPTALGTSMALATLSYAAILLVCIGILAHPAATDRPLAEAGLVVYGSGAAALVSAGAVVIILGTLFVVAIGMPRMLLALAEANHLPGWIGRIHVRWRTPHVAILLSGVIAYGAAMASDLLTLLTISTSARLVSYVLSCIALWRLARRGDAPAATFRLPATAVTALLTATLFAAILFAGAYTELPALLGALAIGLCLMVACRIRPVRRDDRAMPAAIPGLRRQRDLP